MGANEATRQGNNFGGVLIGMVVALMLAGAAGLVLSEHGVIAIKSNGELVQPTADVAVPTRGTGVVNPPNGNGGLTSPQGAPQGNVESVPTVAPLPTALTYDPAMQGAPPMSNGSMGARTPVESGDGVSSGAIGGKVYSGGVTISGAQAGGSVGNSGGVGVELPKP